MKPTSIIYWTRVLLGIVAAIISTLLSTVITDINLFNGLTIALLVYVVTHYIYKSQFVTKVEKPTKIFTTGIFAYFLTWLVTWIIFYTAFIHQ
jgi:ABC-type transporter Mla maintaining outer membrane lipid asymmetry permease subunit MlaE